MTSQLNVRIPASTQEQIEMLVADTGMTQTQIVILAIDRYYQARERDKDLGKQLHGKKVEEMPAIIEQHRKDMAMYINLNTPIDRAHRDEIVALLAARGYDGANRLPETLTLDYIYGFYRCQDGDPAARGIYHIVDLVMNS